MDHDPTQPAGPPTRPDVTGLDDALPAEQVPEAPSRARRLLPFAIGGVLVVLLAAGAGAFLLLRGSDEVLFDQVPQEADVVVAGYLDPAASQKVNLLRIAERFPDLGTRAEITAEVDDVLDEALGEIGLTHEDLGWVGVEVALWVDVPSTEEATGALLVDSDDDATAQAALAKAVAHADDGADPFTSTSYDGVDIWAAPDGPAIAVADGTMILGSETAAVEATIDTGRGAATAIDASPAFADALDDLPEAKLMVAYVGLDGVTGAVEDAIEASGTTGTTGQPLDFGGLQTVAMSVSATDTGLAVDVTQISDPAQLSPEVAAALDAPPHDNPALSITPADAFGVVAIEHMDVLLQEGFDSFAEQEPTLTEDLDELGITGEDGLLANMTGDLAIEAGPGGPDPVAGALMLGVDDPAQMEAFIDDTLTEIGGTTPTWVERDHRGVTLRSFDDPSLRLTYAVVDGMLVIGSSPQHVESIVDVAQDGGGLAEDEGFVRATDGTPPADSLTFVDVPAVLQAVRDELPPDALASFDEEVGDNLDPIGHVVMGLDGEAGRQHLRLFVEIR